MSGAAIEIRLEGLPALNSRVSRLLAGLKNPEPLLRELAAEGEAQTRRRMEFEKRGPDGTPWPEWSPGVRLSICSDRPRASPDATL